MERERQTCYRTLAMTVLASLKNQVSGVALPIMENLPATIQVGMGIAVSSRRLVQAVSQLGVVSGTALWMSSSSLTNPKTPTSGEASCAKHGPRARSRTTPVGRLNRLAPKHTTFEPGTPKSGADHLNY
jgi:hypothetical protein